MSGSNDKTVRVWDLASGEVLLELMSHGGDVQSVAFSRDGEYIVSGGEDGIVRVWNVHSLYA